MFKVHQVKVHIFGIPKFLQQLENLDANEVDITTITQYIKKHVHVFLKNSSKF